MGKQINTLLVRLSPTLKQDFRAVCDEEEVALSEKVRQLIRETVKARKREKDKP